MASSPLEESAYQVGVGETEPLGLGGFRACQEDVRRLSVPAGAVNDAVAVARKTRSGDEAAPEREPLKRGLGSRWRLPEPLPGDEGYRSEDSGCAQSFPRSRPSSRGRGRRLTRACLGQVVADACEVLREVLGRGVAALGVLREAALHDPAQWRRHLGIDRRRSASAPRSGSPPSVSTPVLFWNARLPVAIS